MKCTQCGEDKSESEFYANRRKCRECLQAYQKGYYNAHVRKRTSQAGKYRYPATLPSKLIKVEEIHAMRNAPPPSHVYFIRGYIYHRRCQTQLDVLSVRPEGDIRCYCRRCKEEVYLAKTNLERIERR